MPTTHGVAPFPLYWPLEHPRAKSRRAAKFQVDFATARGHLLRQLDLLGARDVVLSSNIPLRRDGLPGVPDREPGDPGVAAYFTRKGRGFVVACDQFDRVRWNVRAIGSTLEALRSIERHGTTSMLEQAFSGFAQLPPATSPRPWRDVLGFASDVIRIDADDVRARVRELARVHHPDVGGSGDRMAEINAACESALRELQEGASAAR
jgi:hypothetical protein